MRRRLYFLLPDVKRARQVVKELLVARIEECHERIAHFLNAAVTGGTDSGVLGTDVPDPGQKGASTSCVLSLEPSSMTIISSPSMACASTLCTARTISAARLFK